MTDNSAMFLDLEEKLAQDVSGAVRKEWMEDLRSWQAKVKRQMDSGLPPKDFERFQKIHAALDSAVTVVDKAWASFHERG